MRFFLTVVATLLLEAFPVDFALADGFVATPPMPTARETHTATELNTHKVLVVGGEVPVSGSGVSIATTALYDPAVNTWVAGPSMGTARSGHTAVLLNGGKVLVVGGVDNTGAVLASAEVYDPAANTWTPVASMSQARTCHTATLLVPSNKVLIAGGSSDRYCYLNAFASSEIYDPVANTWSAGGAMTIPRVGHTATLLLGGSVLAAGGFTGGNSGSFPVQTERYNPTTNTWSASGALSIGRTGHTATFLPGNGSVLLTGGQAFANVTAVAEIYNPTTTTWELTGSMALQRHHHTASLYTSAGKTYVLVAGGNTTTFMGALASAELYDMTTGNWSPAGGPMTTARIVHASTQLYLSSGKVLISGGNDGIGTALASAELYGPTSATVTVTTVSSATNPSHVGQAVNFYTNVQGAAPTGTVTFYDGAAVLCANVTVAEDDTFNSTAGCFPPPLSAGSHNITVVYNGDANNAGSTSAILVQVVNPNGAAAVPAPALRGWGLAMLMMGLGGLALGHRRWARR